MPQGCKRRVVTAALASGAAVTTAALAFRHGRLRGERPDGSGNMKRTPWPLEEGPPEQLGNSDSLAKIDAARHGRVAEAARRTRR